MNAATWLDATAFARAAGISRQAAHGAMKTCLNSHARWRGCQLVVRTVQGRGGRGGLSYQVQPASLPEEIQRSLTGLSEADKRPLSERVAMGEADKDVALARGRWAIIEPILAAPAQSAARAVAIRQQAAQHGVAERTLRKWVARIEKGQGGLGSLLRKPRCDREARRFRLWKRFDDAFISAGGTLEALDEIAAFANHSIKRLWAGRGQSAGWFGVAICTQQLLIEKLEQRGVALPERATMPPRHVVEVGKAYRMVDIRDNDRKRYNDLAPRIKRSWAGLAPMEQVCTDVKHVDVLVRRPDGSEAWPKMVAFADMGSGQRMFYKLFLLPSGEGIRQEHIIETFIAMAQHPEFGVPLSIYMDNGSEFACLAKIERELARLAPSGSDGGPLVRAMPYQAQSKPIEGAFARIDKYLFAALPGYAGGDRMNKKTQQMGKSLKPYPGSWEAFQEETSELMAAYNATPIGSGENKGKSPQDIATAKREAGWRPILVDRHALSAAFRKQESRMVRRGAVSVSGVSYVADGRLAGEMVTVALPWSRDDEPLFRFTGGQWQTLPAEIALPARWKQGAIESQRRQQATAKRVAAMKAEAAPLDHAPIKRRFGKRVAKPSDRFEAPPLLALPPRIAALAAGEATAKAGQGEAASRAMTRQEWEDRQTEQLMQQYGIREKYFANGS